LNRFWTWRRFLALAVSAVLLLGASGCAGGARATSWTGLTIVGDRLYAADLEQVVALNAADGQTLWVFSGDADARESFYVAPAVEEGYVIVASHMPAGGFFSQPTNAVWALDPDTGAGLWHFDGAKGQYVEGGAIGEGIVVIGNSDGNIYALDLESGGHLWTFETGHRVWAAPLIVEGIVYIGSMDRHLYALDLATGRERWSFHAGGAFASKPALQDGILYVGAFDDCLYAIDAQTGTERWHFVGDSWFWGGAATDGDVVYIGGVNGNVYAVDAETGEQVWKRSLGEPVRAGVALAEDGSKLFVGSQDGTLYALDTTNGLVLWPGMGVEKPEGQVLSTPVVNGTMVYEMRIFGSQRIRALHVDNGRDVWTYAPADENE
jgi:outer membrane protein assembly factor BamB